MRYSKEGKKQDKDQRTGTIKNQCKQFSLTYLMSRCTDFTEQKTDAEQLCEDLSSFWTFALQL